VTEEIAPRRPAAGDPRRTSPVELVIEPRRRRIGHDEVDRLLPYRARRMIGPFVYADLIGPGRLPPGVGVDVPVHPHIGLATITYLFAGALVHRDSTGAVQRIEPGGVNWMTAGAAVSHSERSPDDELAADTTIAGLQIWVALPDEAESVEPSFHHVPAGDVPVWTEGDVSIRLVAGEVGGHRSSVPTCSPLVHVDVTVPAGASWRFPAGVGERGVIVLHGDVTVDGVAVPERHLGVLADGAEGEIAGVTASRVIGIGGAPVGPREISWNFVSSDPERIARARDAWQRLDWPLVPGDDEVVPLP
jgi:redox-sensitive bicupin YhaK (pirin superfamily)